MSGDTFVVHKEWLDNIAGLPLEQQDKIIAEFVRYGTGLGLVYPDDPVIVAMVNMLKNRIDFSKDKYQKKVDAGQSRGRKKKYDDYQVYEMAHSGMKAREIAEIVGVSESTINHSSGWQSKNDDFYVRPGE